MLKSTIGMLLVACCSTAMAEWRDVNYTATLPADYIYCTSGGNLDDFGAYAQDGDEAGANRMVSEGKCRISSGMTVNVFQEDERDVTFLAPSGKAFYTFKGFLQ